jgi:hypothetical protein
VADEDEPAPSFEAPHPNGAVHASGTSHGRRVRRRLILGGSFLFIAVWIFAIVWSVTVTTKSPERLDGGAANAVDAACRTAQHQLNALPNSYPIQGADRVARVRAENVVMRAMINQFGAVDPQHRTPTNALRGWTDDWSRVIDARATYANELEAGKSDPTKKVKFVLPSDAGALQPVTNKMDDFVRENHPNIDACFTNALQADVVEGPRTYGKPDPQ